MWHQIAGYPQGASPWNTPRRKSPWGISAEADYSHAKARNDNKNDNKSALP